MATATPILSHLAQVAAIPGGAGAMATCLGVAILTIIIFAFFMRVLRDPNYGERE